MLPVVAGLLLAVAAGGRGSAAGDQESPPGSRFVCTSLPLDAAGAGCPLPPVPMQGGALPPEEELKATVLQLRETVLQQKETIGSQREAIRELTGKLSRCESADGKSAPGTWKKELGKGKDTMGDLPRDPAQVIDQLSRTMQTLKDRLESLEVGPGWGWRGGQPPARPRGDWEGPEVKQRLWGAGRAQPLWRDPNWPSPGNELLGRHVLFPSAFIGLL